jgi:von Willebrand factor type A domain/Putative Flp pilus-assembly TadE/G-like
MKKRLTVSGFLADAAVHGERGFVLTYIAVTLVFMLLMTGLALDGGRAYVVKAQLTKAVDGAALAAARMLNSGDPVREARSIFRENFPDRFMNTDAGINPSVDITTDEPNSRSVIRVAATANMPTTFMYLGGIEDVDVSAEGEATRRMVDLSLVLDTSGSIGWRWPYVRDAARSFVRAFSETHDRVSLVFYGNGGPVIYQMPSSRGFGKTTVVNSIPNTLPGGSTAMVQGLYRGWDELRTVPNAERSSLRVIVLFTDGCSNSVPGNYDGTGVAKGLRTWDFPDRNDPDNQTWNDPWIDGLYHTTTGNQSPNRSVRPARWSDRLPTVPNLPLLPQRSFHGVPRSSGIPTAFDLQVSNLTVDGVPQDQTRGLRDRDPVTGRYPTQVWNINNAARNLVEIIANAARAETIQTERYRIRIYTIGMGELVRLQLGTRAELAEDILKRIANDPDSADYNNQQLAGRYFFARDETEVDDAFNQLQAEIIRLTK